MEEEFIMKKKMLALSMAVLMVASLAGCSSGAKETETTAAASEAGAETAAESEGETAADCRGRNPDYGYKRYLPAIRVL